MKLSFTLLLVFFSITAFSQTYYIVRHAEKAQASNGGAMATSNNPPLTAEGEKRALALKELLKNKNIRYIYSTNTTRTLSTARPLSEAINVSIDTYAAADTAFIKKIKALKKNVLIVGHSNTIDDITNALCNSVKVNGDIPDNDYDNLFIVKDNKKKVKFEARKY